MRATAAGVLLGARLPAGLGWAIAAVACFASLDTTTKLLTGWLPLTMVVWARYAFLFGVTALDLQRPHRRGLWRTRHLGVQVTRALCLLATTALAFASLKLVSLADYTAVLMLTPLVVGVAATALLGESATRRQWLYMAVSFMGALLVIRPGGHPTGWASLLPLAMVATNAAYQLLTARLARDEDPQTMQLYTGLVGLVVMSMLLPVAWATPSTAVVWAALLAMCVFSVLGHLLLIRAYALTAASRVAPLLYAQIVFALLIDWLAFGRTPDAWSWVGVALISGFGVAAAAQRSR